MNYAKLCLLVSIPFLIYSSVSLLNKHSEKNSLKKVTFSHTILKTITYIINTDYFKHTKINELMHE